MRQRPRWFPFSEVRNYRTIGTGALAASGAAILALLSIGQSTDWTRVALFCFVVGTIPLTFCAIGEDDEKRPSKPALLATSGCMAVAMGYFALMVHLDLPVLSVAFAAGTMIVIAVEYLTRWFG